MALGTGADTLARRVLLLPMHMAHPELPPRKKGCSSHRREAWVGRSHAAPGRTGASLPCADARLQGWGFGKASGKHSTAVDGGHEVEEGVKKIRGGDGRVGGG